MRIIICSIALAFIVGCSTVKGVGDDISTVGKWFVKGSDAVKDGEKK